MTALRLRYPRRDFVFLAVISVCKYIGIGGGSFGFFFWLSDPVFFEAELSISGMWDGGRDCDAARDEPETPSETRADSIKCRVTLQSNRGLEPNEMQRDCPNSKPTQ